MTDWLTIAIAIISSNALTVVLTMALNRKKTAAEADKVQAEAEDTRVGTALKLVNELQEELSEVRKRFQEYRQSTDVTIADLMTELRIQEKAIDNLEAKTLKYQLVLSILIMQLRQSGLEPLVDPQEIDLMETDDLRAIARGMSNVEFRRQKRQQERDDD